MSLCFERLLWGTVGNVEGEWERAQLKAGKLHVSSIGIKSVPDTKY